MGFRFHKRLKLLPGLFWNVGKRGSSFSVKIGGLTKNFSSRGTRTTVNPLPGSGLTYSRFAPRREASRQTGCLGKTILRGLALFIVISVLTALGSKAPAPQNTSAANSPSPASTTPVSATTPAPPVDPYHGTAVGQFAKDWVIVDGERINGITLVLPARGAQASIIYSTGGRNVLADKLPQGFLDPWNLTPARLKSADRQ